MPSAAASPNKRLVLVAMIFAVAMMFIDQTIVALAIPQLDRDLSLSATGGQWIINGYLLSLSALFAFGGKLSDVLGHRRTVTIGVVGFAVCSALCGATPTGDVGETWMIVFRILQGAFAALLFPAALAIVVAAFPLRERGRALALFFGVTGGLTAVGPLAGGYLTEWTWRAIFWINIPVAIIALVLIAKSKPAQNPRPSRIDYRGAVLISAAMGLIVLGLQQASTWGWDDLRTWACIVAGIALLGAFVASQLKQSEPLIQVRIFAQRAFAADNAVLFLMSAAFVPLFFFASVYAQASLGYDASSAGTLLLVFFGGFVVASQWGGKILDDKGAKPAVVLGCALAAVGFYLWGTQLPDLNFSDQWYYLALAGAGIGLVLGPVSTDAVNRAPNTSYGEVTGITQTTRNFGASLGLAIMGSIFATESASHAGGRALADTAQLDVAHATQTVVWIMAGVMAAAFLVARLWMPSGRVEDPLEAAAAADETAAAPETPAAV
ncbi:MFS transporter [Conexibacter stalactiti]|uniref:MFS transporter n=1 Tax=Conexibacter stalactiti TaxID=1940611 RepID=A0ABU4HR20_9ACTN|nr:MFS transporter [Conexibacter stalactiti]MDW5595722.1 MFS transporter [Conexibacter stalactiti]MEC5036364.1 MFS transporter [Conexibacter stalactiti]